MKAGLLPLGAVMRERRPGAVVLCYHRVGGGTARQLDVPADVFEWQMAYLRRRCRVVGLDDLAELTEKRTFPDGDIVAITFDDGYEDTYCHAFPILMRFGLPATVYLTTWNVETGRAFSFEEAVDATSRGAPLTWSQVREMAASGLVTFGAHTHTHPRIARLPAEEARREIEQANALIEERTGARPVHFAYPWGEAGGPAEAIVRETYRTAALGGTRKNAYAAMDLLGLRRVPIQRSDGRVFFMLKLGSYLHPEEWARTLAGRRARPSPGASTN